MARPRRQAGRWPPRSRDGREAETPVRTDDATPLGAWREACAAAGVSLNQKRPEGGSGTATPRVSWFAQRSVLPTLRGAARSAQHSRFDSVSRGCEVPDLRQHWSRVDLNQIVALAASARTTRGLVIGFHRTQTAPWWAVVTAGLLLAGCFAPWAKAIGGFFSADFQERSGPLGTRTTIDCARLQPSLLK
jgi:hypothetical protein